MEAKHIYIIQVSTPVDLGDTSETWTLATLRDYALRFLPPDAKSMEIESQGGGQGETVHDLNSSRLAATFSPDRFTDDGGDRQVQSGMLNWSVLTFLIRDRPLTSSVNTCYVVIGTYN